MCQNRRHDVRDDREPITEGFPSIFEDGDLYELLTRDATYGLDYYLALARGRGRRLPKFYQRDA